MNAKTVRHMLSALCIGVACGVLQPSQPQSIIATVLLVAAIVVVTW